MNVKQFYHKGIPPFAIAVTAVFGGTGAGHKGIH